jgi:predicted PurR-regulated permease PerM
MPTDPPSPVSSPELAQLQMPVSIRSVSLAVIALLAGLFVLHWARAVFIPFMLGLVFSYALSPLVNWMESRRVPRAVGAGILMLSLLAAGGTTTYALSDEAVKLVESLPAAAQKFRQTIKARQGGSGSTLDTVQKAATQIEQATQETALPATSRGVMRVVVEPARFNIKDYLWTGTIGLATLLGQITVVVFLTYFLMVSGNTFRRKLIKLAGPSLSSKKVTL